MKRYLLALSALIAAGLLTAEPTDQRWSDIDQTQLLKQAEKAYQVQLYVRRSYHWPFSEAARAAINREFGPTVPLFAYGSLLNHESAARTLGTETLKTMEPAVAFGIRRVFDYDPIYTGRAFPEDNPARAMLNVHETDDVADMVNGVLVEIPREDLFGLSEREVGYDLIPVLVATWADLLSETKPTFSLAYTLSAPRDRRSGKQFTNPNLTPYPPYSKIVEEGAQSYGDEFWQLWKGTTYRGDARTKLYQEAP